MPYGTVNADVIQTSTSGGILGAGNASIMKNRIINGAMVIDQRNAGASQSIASSAATYTLDRYRVSNQTDGALTSQQTTTAPTGFNNSQKITITTADSSLASGQFLYLGQWVEGFNFADCGWGTANAKTVTLSFWVRSSLTGTFGGSFTNENVDRSYPFTYTISVADTWTQISVTVAGDTTGTWVGATNGIGVRVFFGLGVASNLSGTAGSWSGNAYYSATGATSVIGTNSSTFYITGVQLEVGSSATGFEYVNYQTSLANCQRYYFIKRSNDSASDVITTQLSPYNGTHLWGKWFDLPVQQRASGTVALSSNSHFGTADAGGSTIYAWTSVNTPSADGLSIISYGSITASSAGWTAGQNVVTTFTSSSGWISSSAEL